MSETQHHASDSTEFHHHSHDGGETRREFLKDAITGTAALTSSLIPDMATAQQKSEKLHILTQQEIEQLLKERAATRPVDVVLAQEGCKCVDGRGTNKETFGLAGGDLGPVSAMLAAAEEITGQTVDRKTAYAVIDAIPGTAYLHTDDHAMHALHETGELHGQNIEETVLHGPKDPEHRTAIADLLADPRFIGCGHMKQIITQQETDASGPYRMRPALGRTILSAAYERAWQQRERTTVESLHGEHGEAAVAVLTVKGGIRDGKTPVPVMQPCAKDASGKTIQTFVNQPQVGEYRLDQLLPIVVAALPALKGKEMELRKRSSEILDLQTGETVKRLATSKGKPVFTAEYDQPDAAPAVK